MAHSHVLDASCLLLLSVILVSVDASASPVNIWHVSIWEAPAPPPGKGSPLQASALRDKSYLPAQIASIVAGYVLSLLFIGSALLFVGRRLRRSAQASPKSLAMEMIKPLKTDVPKAFDPSPVSPATSKQLYGSSPADTLDMRNNWPSPDKSTRGSFTWGSNRRTHSKRQPSIQSSVVTFDESVIEEDRERNEREMERLYAAVMDHDEKKTASSADLPANGLAQHPLELQHLREVQAPPRTPSRLETISPARNQTRSPQSSHRPTPLSLHSPNSSRSSLGSFGKKRGARQLAISPPMGSPDLVPDATYNDTEPLSPRLYNDPGPPPPTPPQRMSAGYREARSPREVRFPDFSARTPRTPVPSVPQSIPEFQQPIPEIRQPIPEIRQPVPPPLDEIGRQSASHDGMKTKRTPAPLPLRAQAPTNLNATPHQNSSLRTAPLPLRNPYPTNWESDRPESMIKATVIETKPKSLGHNLRTPRTGVPMTPYSPYMPFTPLTPMTPSRLVTREERKRREKEEGRRVMTAEDAVIEEEDAWGDAYP